MNKEKEKDFIKVKVDINEVIKAIIGCISLEISDSMIDKLSPEEVLLRASEILSKLFYTLKSTFAYEERTGDILGHLIVATGLDRACNKEKMKAVLENKEGYKKELSDCYQEAQALLDAITKPVVH